MPVTGPSPLRSTRSERPAHLLWGPTSETSPAVLLLPSVSRDRSILRDRLTRAGAVVSLSVDLPDALQTLGTRNFDLVVVDLAGERMARATIRLVRSQFPGTAVCAVIDAAQPITATEAIEAGVVDLLPWPCRDEDVAAMLVAAREASPADADASMDIEDRLFHQSPAMRSVLEAIRSLAGTRTSVTICGESGSGRSLVARTLHDRDHDYLTGPFVLVDCNRSARDLEHHLFGGCDKGRPEAELVSRGSAVLAAQGGSLFLKDLSAAPPRVQHRLARMIREQEIFSADARETVAVAFRVLASLGAQSSGGGPSAPLEPELVEALGPARIDVPALRQRREDIPLLASHFLRQACVRDTSSRKGFSRAALTLLAALPWSRNGRELRDVVAASLRRARGSVIQLDEVLEHARMDASAPAPVAPGVTLRDARKIFERECISATLLRHRGKVGDAAKALGIQRTNLYRKVRQLNVPRALLSPHDN